MTVPDATPEGGAIDGAATLRVNECCIFATRMGADWWHDFRAYAGDRGGRIITITASVAGDLVDVACDDLDHAKWLARTAEANGVPRSALKVRKGALP